MIYPLPAFPPFMAPGHWWRAYLASRLAGKNKARAVVEANDASKPKPRDWMRLRLKDAVVLSLPVAGGASALKNHDSVTWTTAPETLRESRKITATVVTLYGRMPFAAPVLDILDNSFGLLAEGLVKASLICIDCFERVENFLGLDSEGLLTTLREEIGKGNDVLRREKEYRERRTNPSLSIADTLMREGPDAIFTLLPPF